MDVKLQLEGADSNVETGSLEDRSTKEFEDESLFTPEAEFQICGLQNGSVSGGFPSSGNKILQNSVCRSIKIVVFSNKLNLLMPFGPLAIMVHNMTGYKVDYAGMGITPLAERLGYATEGNWLSTLGLQGNYVPSWRNMSTAAAAGLENKEALKLLVTGGSPAQKAVGIWLFGSAAWVSSMVVRGGVTRLTRSGLSMTDWKFTGDLPPLSDEEWLQKFEKYKQLPEYKH